jgi:hypothetical protein
VATPRELEHRVQACRPWRAYAAMYLWRIARQSNPREARSSSRQAQKHAAAGSAPDHSISMAV